MNNIDFNQNPDAAVKSWQQVAADYRQKAKVAEAEGDNQKSLELLEEARKADENAYAWGQKKPVIPIPAPTPAPVYQQIPIPKINSETHHQVSSRFDFNDFLQFRILITKSVYTFIWLLGVFCVFIWSIAAAGMSVSAIQNKGIGFLVGIFVFLIALVLGNIAWRIVCEIVIVLFSIQESSQNNARVNEEILEELKKQNRG